MVRQISFGLREAILSLAHLNHSSRKIVAILKERNLTTSKSTVNRVIEEDAATRAGLLKDKPLPRTHGKPKKRTMELIRKVKRDVSGANPATQRKLARKHCVSQRTIGRIIRKDLDGILKKKYRVHALSDKQVRQRLERGPRFLQYIKGQKWKYVITVDEAWIYLTHVNGVRKVYYEFKGERTRESWTKFWKESHPVGVMFIGGVCSRGTTKLRFVDPGAKINSQYYIDSFLKPLFEEDIPRLYPGEEHKVVFHHDNAPAHSSALTQQFLRDSDRSIEMC